jgi:hypothetical protein
MGSKEVQALRTINDKENHSKFPGESSIISSDVPSRNIDRKKLQDENTRLEKLYKEQVINNQSLLHEQERLELELLVKEKELFSQQKTNKRISELNTELNDKLKRELHYYESEIAKFQELESHWESNLSALRTQNLEFGKKLNKKDEEIEHLNVILDKAYDDLQTKERELSTLLRQNCQSDEDLIVEDSSELIEDENASDEDTNGDNLHPTLNDEFLRDDSDDDEIHNQADTSANLADQLSSSIDEKEKLLLKYRFSVNALKKEKDQLYSYINKLLRNKPHPEQNTILKTKLVNRKILRIISASNTVDSQNSLSAPGKKRRVTSNYVNLKSYHSESIKLNSNSDDEDTDEYESKYLGIFEIGHRLFVGESVMKLHRLNPMRMLKRAVHPQNEDEIITEDTSELMLDNWGYSGVE